jgi:hypothetical protein
MTATLYGLNRLHDVSGVSGEGDDKATVCEFESGLVAMHWNSDTPTVEVLTDIRHVTKLHAHGGASVLSILENRLVRAYQRVVPWVVSAQHRDRPITCAPHPDHPDRLRLTLKDEIAWRFWVALFDGSTEAATHTEVAGEIQHQWIDPEGDLWLTYYTPTATSNDPEEDR